MKLLKKIGEWTEPSAAWGGNEDEDVVFVPVPGSTFCLGAWSQAILCVMRVTRVLIKITGKIMLAVLNTLSLLRWSHHWAVTLSHWPYLLHLLIDVKEPTSLFEKRRGRVVPVVMVLLVHMYSWVGWVGWDHECTDSGCHRSLYKLTSDLSWIVKHILNFGKCAI